MFQKDALSYRSGDIVADRYRVTGSLGRGGFGAVYSAEHTMTGQPMALKMLAIDPTTTDDDVVERFYREARITAQLTDVHTVRVFDVGQAENGPMFMAMEMLRGPPLDKLLRRLSQAGRPMSEAETIDIAMPILQSLSEAHKAGLVHRDLKPANIILAYKGDAQMVVKVLDFGIARTKDSSLTEQGKALGTPAYMSPEQVKGKTLDGRSDLYSLGIIMFRCLTGQMPFENDDPIAQAFMHLTVPAPDPREIAPHPISDPIAEVVLSVLSKDPEDRFADARVMRQALQEIRVRAWESAPVAVDTLGADGVAPPTAAKSGQTGAKTASVLMNLLVDVEYDSLKTPAAVITADGALGDEATQLHRNASDDANPSDMPTKFIPEAAEKKLQPPDSNSPSNVATRALDVASADNVATLAIAGKKLEVLRADWQKKESGASNKAVYLAAVAIVAVIGGALALTMGGASDAVDESAAAQAAKAVGAAVESPTQQAPADKTESDKIASANKTASVNQNATDIAAAPVAKAAGADRLNVSMKLAAEATKEADPHAKRALLQQAVKLAPDNEAYAALLQATEKVILRHETVAALGSKTAPDREAKAAAEKTSGDAKAAPEAKLAKPQTPSKPKKVEEPYVDF